MAIRYRRSVKLAPGVRLNVSKTGLGVSVGPRGARYSVHSSGRRTTSLGVPGTGLSSVTSKTAGRARQPAATPAAPKKPGLLSPKADRELFAAFQEQDLEALTRLARAHAKIRGLAVALAGLVAMNVDTSRAAELLGDAHRANVDPSSHPFMRKYLPHAGISLPVAPGIEARVPMTPIAVALAYAEVLQELGKIEKAIEVVEDLPPSAEVTVSLAELLSEAGRHNDVIELTDGLTNSSDVEALLCVYRGAALREQGMYEAARAALKEALKSKKREAEIRHLAWWERALTYEAEGRRGMARKDLERILAEDSTYEGLRERIAALS